MEEGASEAEERGEDEQQQGTEPRHRGGVPKNRFLGVEFSFFPPQPDTSDTEKVGAQKLFKDPRVGPGMRPRLNFSFNLCTFSGLFNLRE